MLGKGLESLIPKKQPPKRDPSDNDSNFSDSSLDSFDKSFDNGVSDNSSSNSNIEPPKISGPIFHVEVEKIVLNPYQPRKEFDEESLRELAASIREFGILQPLVVSKIEEETESGTKVTYQLIAGQRRLMAAKLLSLKTVPVVIKSGLKKTEALEMAIVENIQRANLNIIETARAYARLSDEFGLTQREIAARLGKSREAIANAVRLLSLPTEIQEAISKGKINESQARLLLQIEEPDKQMEVFNKIINQNLSVREIRNYIKKEVKNSQDQSKPLVAQDIELKQLERDLSEFLGAPVNVEFSRAGGKIIIHFYSPEEAKGIVEKIKPQDLI
jgi:ParB family chromosome partitioning protein